MSCGCVHNGHDVIVMCPSVMGHDVMRNRHEHVTHDRNQSERIFGGEGFSCYQALSNLDVNQLQF